MKIHGSKISIFFKLKINVISAVFLMVAKKCKVFWKAKILTKLQK